MYELAGIPVDLGASTAFVMIPDDALPVNPLPKFVVVVIMVSDAPASTVPLIFDLRTAHSDAVMLTQSPVFAEVYVDRVVVKDATIKSPAGAGAGAGAVEGAGIL